MLDVIGAVLVTEQTVLIKVDVYNDMVLCHCLDISFTCNLEMLLYVVYFL